MRDKNLAKRFKPCMLVSFYAHRHRAHDYKVTDKKASRLEDGSEMSSWSTTKHVKDPENAKVSGSLRGKFIREITKLGAQYGQEKLVFVDFERRDDLEALEREWRTKIEEFNQQSPLVKVDFGTLPPLDLTGSNEYFLGKLVDEMQDTLGNMREALEKADYRQVRKVLTRMRGFMSVVPDDTAAAISVAIKDAQRQARLIRKELVKRGTAIEEVRGMVNTATVDLALSATLMEEEAAPEVDAAELIGAMAEQHGAALEFDQPDDVPVETVQPFTGSILRDEEDYTTAPTSAPIAMEL